MSYRRTEEEIGSIAILGEKLGLHPTLTGYRDGDNFVAGHCITEKQVQDMGKLIEWANLEYGLEYEVILDTEKEYGEKPESDLNKMLIAVDTIRKYTNKYNVPQLNQTGVIEELESAVMHLRPVADKQRRSFEGVVRKALGKRLNEFEYKNKKKLLDGLMNTFKDKEH